MKIIGKQGRYAYLVQIDDTFSRVLDINLGFIFPKFNTQSILARGYWEDYIPKEGELEELLSQVVEYNK